MNNKTELLTRGAREIVCSKCKERIERDEILAQYNERSYHYNCLKEKPEKIFNSKK